MIDLSQLAAPDVVEALDYETILAAMLVDLQARDVAFTALVESDPAMQILEVAAYRELLLRQRVNDAARQGMLAYATGTNLDHLAALYGLTRLQVDPGDPEAVPPVAPTYETDARLRERAQLAPESFSTAGPSGAYRYHALSASALVADVDVAGNTAGQVFVTVLGTTGNGVPAAGVLDAVFDALNARDVRPLTDEVVVQVPTVVSYAVEAEVYVFPGPDTELVRQSAEDAVTAHVAEQRRLGRSITLSGLYAALHRPGVERVTLLSPLVEVTVDHDEVGYCTGITVNLGISL